MGRHDKNFGDDATIHYCFIWLQYCPDKTLFVKKDNTFVIIIGENDHPNNGGPKELLTYNNYQIIMIIIYKLTDNEKKESEYVLRS